MFENTEGPTSKNAHLNVLSKIIADIYIVLSIEIYFYVSVIRYGLKAPLVNVCLESAKKLKSTLLVLFVL